MSYDRLSPKEKEVLDYMINPKTVLAKPIRPQIAQHFNIKVSTLRNYFNALYAHYGIDENIYSPQVRLIYLRARELRLI